MLLSSWGDFGLSVWLVWRLCISFAARCCVQGLSSDVFPPTCARFEQRQCIRDGVVYSLRAASGVCDPWLRGILVLCIFYVFAGRPVAPVSKLRPRGTLRLRSVFGLSLLVSTCSCLPMCESAWHGPELLQTLIQPPDPFRLKFGACAWHTPAGWWDVRCGKSPGSAHACVCCFVM